MNSPLIAKAAQAGQFVRVLPTPKGELIPLTLADWDAKAGTIDLVIQAMGASTIGINKMEVGEAFAGIAGPLGQPSKLHRYEGRPDGGVHRRRRRPAAGLPDHARAPADGQPRHADRRLPHREPAVLDRRGRARRPAAEGISATLLDVIYASNDGTFGVKGFVTGPLEELLKQQRGRQGPRRSPKWSRSARR